MKNKHPKLSQHLFWDIDTDQLDWEKNAGFLIGRTLDYGLKSDWKAIMEFYGKEKVKEELADVFAFAFLLADKYKLDVKEIVLEKIKKNGEKYPIDKAKGTSKKYDEL